MYVCVCSCRWSDDIDLTRVLLPVLYEWLIVVLSLDVAHSEIRTQLPGSELTFLASVFKHISALPYKLYIFILYFNIIGYANTLSLICVRTYKSCNKCLISPAVYVGPGKLLTGPGVSIWCFYEHEIEICRSHCTNQMQLICIQRPAGPFRNNRISECNNTVDDNMSFTDVWNLK